MKTYTMITVLILALLIFAVQLSATADNASPVPGKSAQRITNTVDKMPLVSLERRAYYLSKPAGKTAPQLTAEVPEMASIELNNTFSNRTTDDVIHVVSWNTERGANWNRVVDMLNEVPALQQPDVIFLSEMDLGMARSYNMHTARNVAILMGMNYAYGAEFLELGLGNSRERRQFKGQINEYGYHGNAILSKYPLTHVRIIRFPGIEKWYTTGEIRLGGRMAILADIVVNGKIITLCCTHLESDFNEPDIASRNDQAHMILNELETYSCGYPWIVGGDINAKPEEPAIATFRAAGLTVDESNDMSQPTQVHLDENGLVRIDKFHIDYILTKGFDVIQDDTSPLTVLAARPPVPTGKIIGDHAAITVRLRLK